MRYTAKPVEVEARIITGTSAVASDGSMRLTLQDGGIQRAHHGMLARYIPVEGDYLVVQEDGYKYINPKDVFERKYAPSKDATEA